MAQPTSFEQYLLELANGARLDPSGEAAREGIGLNNGLASGTISATPKPPLAFNPQLIEAARGHSSWMLATDTFSHVGMSGSLPDARMMAAGYIFTGDWLWGENIAIRSGSGIAITTETINALHDGLFKSADHRENILDGNFREAGFGVASGDYQGGAAVTMTEDFARSGTLPFLTGVVFADRNGDHFYEPGEGLGSLSVQARSDTGQIWQTTTWDAGGYQIQLPAGVYQVAFSGGNLPGPVLKTASIGSANVMLDVDSQVASSVPGSASASVPATEQATQLTPQSLVGTLASAGGSMSLSELIAGTIGPTDIAKDLLPSWATTPRSFQSTNWGSSMDLRSHTGPRMLGYFEPNDTAVPSPIARCSPG
jgi:serralysin